ncbi:hypothetical protein Maq22A_c04930 [Methylobacterium aquaticum]|uniref:Uncharacterized protein n=2 Tax=Methylobacterium aquaticum TaxID=270351 RepID=A0A0C6EWH3_9HYPH|nr:hypothetical protein Maq22A_c04930 [Methylobacterium aquaticum]
MTSYGIPQDDIARVLKISPTTLRLHFRYELDVGATQANVMVAQSLFQKATGSHPQAVTAAIFWLKTRARWKEPPREVSGPNGGPIPTATVDLTKASREQLDALESLFGHLAGEPGGDAEVDPGGEGEAGA